MVNNNLSYTLVEDGRAIRCNTCGKTSYNSEDVRHRFCAFCDRFHDDPLDHLAQAGAPLEFAPPPVDLLAIARTATNGNTTPADFHTVVGALLQARQLEVEAQMPLMTALLMRSNELGDVSEDFRDGMAYGVLHYYSALRRHLLDARPATEPQS